MRNITVSVDDDTYRRSRNRAAELDTSVSALVRTHLRSLAGNSDREAAATARESRSSVELRALLKQVWVGLRPVGSADKKRGG